MRKLTLLLILLVARFTATAADPVWAVNTASFNYSMTVTAVLQLDCEELNANNNRLGAFVGNDLRGSALSSVTVNGRKLVFLTIYSNVVAGETINFKIYNAQTDQIVDGIVTVTFSDDASIGTPSNPRLITDDHVPSNLTLSNASITENNSANATIGTLSVTDLDVSDTHTYSLVAGQGDTDNAAFSISGNSLRINGMANYEVKTSYSVRIRGQDNYGCGVERDFAITVMPANDTPTDLNLSNASIAENLAAGTAIGSLSSVDEDAGETFTYSLVAGVGSDDNASFIIDQQSLKAIGSFNYEVKSAYNIRLRTTDSGGATFEKTVVITIINVNEAPYNFQVTNTSIAENNPVNAVIGNLTVQDQDIGDVVTISFQGTNTEQASFFSITNNQLLALPSFNFETRSTYPVDLIATDVQGLSVALSFTVSILNVNEAPTDIGLSNQSIQENQAVGSTIGNLNTVDEDFNETHTYTLVAGAGDTDNAAFTLAQNVLKTSQTFNFEVKNSYSIRIRTTDLAGATFDEVFAVSIIDVNEAPFNFQISNTSITENNAANAVIGNLSVQDEDIGDVVTISFHGSNTEQANFFGIVNNQLVALPSFNFEVRSSYAVDLVATDILGLSAQLSFTVLIMDVNEAPTQLNISNQSIPENEEVGTLIGNLSTVDEDFNETHTYTLVAGVGDADNSLFMIDQHMVKAAETFNFENKNSYSIRVRTTDKGNLTFDRAFTITIVDVNEVPYDLALSASEIAENLPVGTVIGNLTAQDEDFNDVVTFTLNPSNTSQLSAFSIVNNQLLSGASFNFEQTNSYSIDVVATDVGGLSAEMSYDITVLNVNEAPFNLAFSSESFLEEQAIGTEIGVFSAQDEDAGDTQSYAFVNSGGANDNASFELVGNKLFSKEVYKFRLKSSYTFEVSVTDSQGASISQIFTLAIEELPLPSLPSIDIVTPNGDGINDTWFIEDVGRFYNFSVSIYDSNGQLIYFLKDNYDNSWNGQVKSRNLPTGAYFYVLKNNTTGKTYSGTISLFN